jgi:hypothetical protein
MKSYRFYNDAKTVDVTYLADTYGNQQKVTIMDVKSLNSADIVAGMNLKVGDTYDETALKLKATSLNLNLEILDNQTQKYSGTFEADFLTFTLVAQTRAATIDTDAKTVDIEVANGTTVTALVATFTLSAGATAAIGATAQVSGTTANNFTSAKTYVITGAAGKTVSWTVTVTVAA